MKKFKDWFYNLKIKYKLSLAAIVVIANLLLLLWIASFFYRTTSVFSMMIDTESYHTVKFQKGLEAFQVYVNSGEEKYFQKAIDNIKQANAIAIPILSADSIAQHESSKKLIESFYKYYGPLFNNNKKQIGLMAERIYLFVRLGLSPIQDIFRIVRSGLDTGEETLSLMHRYKKTGDKSILTKLNNKSEFISVFYKKYSAKVDEFREFGMRLLLYLNLIIIILLSVLSYYVILQISGSIEKPVNNLVKNFREIEKGNLSVTIKQHSKDEIGMLVASFNGIQANLQKFLIYAKKIASGNYSVRLQARSEKDEISVALNVMAANLEKNEKQINNNNWLKDGLSELNKMINSDLTLEKLATESLSFLVKYTESFTGALYLNDDGKMHLKATYALDKSKVAKRIISGNGLIGQVWADRKLLQIKGTDNLGVETFSSTARYKAKEAVILPLTIGEEKLIGILEISSTDELSILRLEFIRQASAVLAIAMQAALSRQKIAELLSYTQQQTEELETQQEELRATNAELEEQTIVLRENEKKLQIRQEELKVSNEELEARTHDLEMQRKEILKKNKDLEIAQKEIELKANDLEQASRYKSEFLANMSHELRTPLNSMLILSKDLSNNKKGNLSDDQVESAAIIYNAGNDLLNLINDILDLSKIESGKMQISPVTTSVSEIVTGLQNMFSQVAQERGIYFKTQVDEDMPAVLFTDRQRLDQILKNLISNALKFTRQGGVTIRFRYDDNSEWVEQQTAGNFFCVDVIDTGIGIHKDKQRAIFEAFQQADGSISRNFGGTGLGLSISRQLAKMLGGSIGLKTEYGKGSTFTVCIPARLDGKMPKPVRKTDKIQKPVTQVKTGMKKELVQQPAEEKVEPVVFIPDDRNAIKPNDIVLLIIEDDYRFAKILVKQSRENGFKCIVTSTGEEGLVLAEKYKPNAISLDIKLPGIDGNKVLKLLKENPSTRHIPVQVLSGIDEKDELTDKGILGFLPKPLSLKDISEALRKIKNFIKKEVKELLIVEDDANARKTLEKLLQTKDVKITTTASGKKALQLIENNVYDCVILDLGLNDISGFELIRTLHQEQEVEMPPVIVYTGRDLSKEEVRELQQSVSSVIIKGNKSDERLLDETALFLHQVVDKMDEKKQQLIRKLHDKEAVFDGKQILLVDDDMRNVFALTRILSEHNMGVVEAENGLVALEQLEKHPDIDLVLMDVMMPEMDGYTATKEIRKISEFTNLPIIQLTAKAMKEDREKSIASGASDYLTKPIDVDKLLSLIRVWLYK